MSCNCGEKLKIVFRSENVFTVYFDAERENSQNSPIQWKGEGIRVCIACGDMTTSRVPDSALLELRRGAGGDEFAA